MNYFFVIQFIRISLPINNNLLKIKINIAIDGHSGCGKGTLAKYLAKELGYAFISIGAMYRAVTLYLIQHNFSVNDIKSNPAILKSIIIAFKFNLEKDYYEIYLNNVLVENEIRAIKVTNFVNEISMVKEIRDYLVAGQRHFGKNKGLVMDGTDIGTNILPDAELKIFMTTDPKVRARRKCEELLQSNRPVNYEEVLENIIKRDIIDDTRLENQLVRPHDAIILDNTNMSKEDQGRVALSWARSVISSF